MGIRTVKPKIKMLTASESRIADVFLKSTSMRGIPGAIIEDVKGLTSVNLVSFFLRALPRNRHLHTLEM